MSYSLRRLATAILFAAIALPEHAGASEPKPAFLFLDPAAEAGSETRFNPLEVLVSSGFDVLRQPAYRHEPVGRDYAGAFGNVVETLAHPWRTIEASGGFAEVARHEIIPYRGLSKSGGQWMPNWSLHMLGEGMVSRKLGEWYAARGAPAPYALGIATMAAVQLFNETVENGDFRGPNRDPLVDMYLFNVAGYTLYAFEPVRRFFAGPLRVNYWPEQAAVDVRTGRIVSIGENVAFKASLGGWTDARFFAYASNKGLFGLSYPWHGRDTLSVAAGVSLVDLAPVISTTGARAVEAGDRRNYELAAFYDRRESLLWSVRVAGGANPLVAASLYPGTWKVGGLKLGAFLLASRLDGASAGVTVDFLPFVPAFAFGGDRSLERL